MFIKILEFVKWFFGLASGAAAEKRKAKTAEDHRQQDERKQDRMDFHAVFEATRISWEHANKTLSDELKDARGRIEMHEKQILEIKKDTNDRMEVYQKEIAEIKKDLKDCYQDKEVYKKTQNIYKKTTEELMERMARLERGARGRKPRDH